MDGAASAAGIKTDRVLPRPGNSGFWKVKKTNSSVSREAGSGFPFTWKSATWCPAPLSLKQIVDQLEGDRVGGGLSKDFGDEVLRFHDVLYLARTNHGAEFGSLGADYPTKS